MQVFEEACKWAEQNGLLTQAFDEIPSTNNLAKDKAWWIPDPLIIIAKTQTAGRGRGANTWIDCGNNGSSLLATWSIGLEKAPSHLTAPRVGLALYQAASKVWDEMDFSLKAPNDLLLNQRKLAGLLVEMVQQGSQFRWIIGLGMNFFESPREFPEATCLHDHTLVSVDDFKLFLQLFHDRLLTMIPTIHETKLNLAEQEDLHRALLKTQGHHDLKSVSENGDLIYSNKKTAWSDL